MLLKFHNWGFNLAFLWSNFRLFHFLSLFSVAIKPAILLLCLWQVQHIPQFAFIISIWSHFSLLKHNEAHLCISHCDLGALISSLPSLLFLSGWLWRNRVALFSSFTGMSFMCLIRRLQEFNQPSTFSIVYTVSLEFNWLGTHLWVSQSKKQYTRVLFVILNVDSLRKIINYERESF